MARKPKGREAMTAAERQRRYREKHRAVDREARKAAPMEGEDLLTHLSNMLADIPDKEFRRYIKEISREETAFLF
jgi:hypothetical protein